MASNLSNIVSEFGLQRYDFFTTYAMRFCKLLKLNNKKASPIRRGFF